MKKGEGRRDDVYAMVARNIKIQRQKRHMTQAELAEKTGYSHEYIRRIEAPNTKKYFSIDTISNISDTLEIDIRDLFKKN